MRANLTLIPFPSGKGNRMRNSNLWPFVVPRARLFVRIGRLQHQVFAMTLGDDLQSAWQARVSEARAHRRAGMAAHVERIGEDHGVERMLERLAVDLGRHRALRRKSFGR